MAESGDLRVKQVTQRLKQMNLLAYLFIFTVACRQLCSISK